MRTNLIAVVALAFFALAVTASASHAPTNLTIVKYAAKTVTIGWSPVTGITGYGLYVDGVRVATAGPAATQAKFGTPVWRRYVLGVQALKTGGDTSTITVDPRWVVVSTYVPPEPQPSPACSDGQDNDGDGKVDAADPGCSSPTDTDETDPVTPPPGSVTLTPVDGGTSFYGRFANTAGMDASSYFPIAVWGAYNQTQANRDLDAAAGINMYVWAADSSFMDAIRADGRFKVVQDEGNRSNVGTETIGWLLGDEWDMTGQTCPGQVDAVKSSLPADGRLRYFNFGKGLALPPGGSNFWSDATEQNCFANSVDVDSVDFYWFTDPWQADFCCAYKYGNNISAVRAADASDGTRHPHWSFVETGSPWGPNDPAPKRSITPAELRAAVWHSVIAGARGIVYFQHSFSGPCVGDHHTIRSNCEGTRPMVTSVDAQLKALAPALNSPSVTSGFSATGSVRTLAKWDGSNFYVLAGATAATSASFSIPCVGNATATVVGEGRTLSVVNGSFTDSFTDGNAVHIYRVDGGSRCGL